MPLDLRKVKLGGAGHTVSGAAGGTDQPGSVEAAGGVAGGVADWAGALFEKAAAVPARSARAGVQAVLFDLDGVLVDTARFHYIAWKQLADELGLHFDEKMNYGFRGVGRMECLEKLLGRHAKGIAGEEKRVLAERKNAYYLEQVMTLTQEDVAGGARRLAIELRSAGVRMGVVSASRNAKLVLGLLGIAEWFDTVVDGGDVVKGKPEPEGFLLAARRVRAEAENCVVVEDAEAGIRAGHAAGMTCVGIGEDATGAEVIVRGVAELTLEKIERVWESAGE